MNDMNIASGANCKDNVERKLTATNGTARSLKSIKHTEENYHETDKNQRREETLPTL